MPVQRRAADPELACRERDVAIATGEDAIDVGRSDLRKRGVVRLWRIALGIGFQEIFSMVRLSSRVLQCEGVLRVREESL